VSLSARELYTSPNGDGWFLLYDSKQGDVLVYHPPNAASAGLCSLMTVGELLAPSTYHPEHQALLRLLGALVEQDGMAKEVDPDLAGGNGGLAADERAQIEAKRNHLSHRSC
jgi:hypothetical protein